MVLSLEPAEVTAIECRRWTNLKHKRLYRDAAQLAALGSGTPSNQGLTWIKDQSGSTSTLVPVSADCSIA